MHLLSKRTEWGPDTPEGRNLFCTNLELPDTNFEGLITQPDPKQTPPIPAMPEPCPAQLQPIIIQTPIPTPPSVPPELPTSSPQGKYHHPTPTRRVSHLGPAGGVCGGGGRLGQLMLKGANCHREGGRRPGQLQTLPWPHAHRKSHRLECFNTRTPDPQQKHTSVHTDTHDEMDSPKTVPFFSKLTLHGDII